MSKRDEIKAFITRTVDELTAMMRSARAVKALPASSGSVTVADIVAVVKANPGCNGGTIGRELGKPRHAVLKPIAEALATGKIRKHGSGRWLTYTAGR